MKTAFVSGVSTVSTTLIAAMALALLLAGQAQALTLTNRDALPQRVQVSEEEEAFVTLEIEPNETLEVCNQGCVLYLEDGSEEIFEGHEVVNIEDGRLVIVNE